MRFCSSVTTRSSKPEYVWTMNQSMCGAAAAGAALACSWGSTSLTALPLSVPSSSAEGGEELVHERRHGRVHEEQEDADEDV